ncbi:MAG: hypothetical protein QHC79_09690 [Pseudosphingobacterium sp.]|nr:hypothetical protein [Pseudosphingobacterium sp.]
MGRYSSFGLDEVKRERDEGGKGTGYCLWPKLTPDHNGFYGHNVSRGFSLCFAHFVLCKDCAIQSAYQENLNRWGLNECFKCRSTDVLCYHQREYEFSKDNIAICRECIDWALNTLNESK